MENASKALLIAGAVLLVIAIIAVGMGIFGTARGVVNQTEGQIDNMSIQMHNKQFEVYDKKTLTGKEAKELVSLVIANNKKATTSEFMVEIVVADDQNANKYAYVYEKNIESDNGTYSNTEINYKFLDSYKTVYFRYNAKGLMDQIQVIGNENATLFDLN